MRKLSSKNDLRKSERVVNSNAYKEGIKWLIAVPIRQPSTQ